MPSDEQLKSVGVLAMRLDRSMECVENAINDLLAEYNALSAHFADFIDATDVLISEVAEKARIDRIIEEVNGSEPGMESI